MTLVKISKYKNQFYRLSELEPLSSSICYF